jgi:hypothetical protein
MGHLLLLTDINTYYRPCAMALVGAEQLWYFRSAMEAKEERRPHARVPGWSLRFVGRDGDETQHMPCSPCPGGQVVARVAAVDTSH